MLIGLFNGCGSVCGSGQGSGQSYNALLTGPRWENALKWHSSAHAHRPFQWVSVSVSVAVGVSIGVAVGIVIMPIYLDSEFINLAGKFGLPPPSRADMGGCRAPRDKVS